MKNSFPWWRQRSHTHLLMLAPLFQGEGFAAKSVIRSPLLHLQWLFLLPAVVHGRLRVDAPGRRSALTHRLFASLCVCAPPLRLPPLSSAVLKPNLRSKTIDLTNLDPFAPVSCLFIGGNKIFLSRCLRASLSLRLSQKLHHSRCWGYRAEFQRLNRMKVTAYNNI